MKNITLKSLLMMVFALAILTSCEKDDDPIVDDPIPTEKEFVGSTNCKICHEAKYDDWFASGHPYKFSVIENAMAPEYPVEAYNFQSKWLTELTDGSNTWDNIAGVIGGYGWKTRFVGDDGHIIGTAGSKYNTGEGDNQFNFFGGVDHGWSNYHPEDEKIYNYSCFKCHTTGGTQEGTWIEGVEGLGTFTEGGIGCESCHGPGSVHIDDPSAENIDRVYEFAHLDNSIGGLDINGAIQTPNEASNDVNFLCGTCHNRDYQSPINSKGGFIKHHEQWDEMASSNGHFKNGLSCTTCHDPHKRTIWDGDGVNRDKCAECHTEQVTTTNHPAVAGCIDCHMPFAAKSGAKTGLSGLEGDIRSHLLSITVDTTYSMFTDDGAWVRDDENRSASLSVAYSCLGCHNRDGETKTLKQAVEQAADMHK